MKPGEWVRLTGPARWQLNCSTCLEYLTVPGRSKFNAEATASRAGWRNITRTRSICPTCPHPDRDTWTAWLDQVEAREQEPEPEDTTCHHLHAPGVVCATCLTMHHERTP